MMLSIASTVLIYLKGFDASVIVFVAGAVASVLLAGFTWIVCQRQIRDARRAAKSSPSMNGANSAGGSASTNVVISRCTVTPSARHRLGDRAAGVITYINDRCEISGAEGRTDREDAHCGEFKHPESILGRGVANDFEGKVWHGEICNRAKNGEAGRHDDHPVLILPVVTQYVSIRTDITAPGDRSRARLESVLTRRRKFRLSPDGWHDHPFQPRREKMRLSRRRSHRYLHAADHSPRRRSPLSRRQLTEQLEKRSKASTPSWAGATATYRTANGPMFAKTADDDRRIGRHDVGRGRRRSSVSRHHRPEAADAEQYTAALEDARLKMEAQPVSWSFRPTNRRVELADAAIARRAPFSPI
jgi:hypothetical protein